MQSNSDLQSKEAEMVEEAHAKDEQDGLDEHLQDVARYITAVVEKAAVKEDFYELAASLENLLQKLAEDDVRMERSANLQSKEEEMEEVPQSRPQHVIPEFELKLDVDVAAVTEAVEDVQCKNSKEEK